MYEYVEPNNKNKYVHDNRNISLSTPEEIWIDPASFILMYIQFNLQGPQCLIGCHPGTTCLAKEYCGPT